MPQKKDGNKIILMLVTMVLVVLLFGGTLYFKKSQETDLPPANDKTMVPEKTKKNKLRPNVKADKNNSSVKTVETNETLSNENITKIDQVVTPGNDVKKVETTTKETILKTGEIVQGKIIVLPDIDFKNLKKDKELNQLMVSRKEELGFNKSLDMIVNSDESFKVGDVQIPLRDILEKASFNQGKVFEEKIEESGAVQPEKIIKFGIYVVQPGDNIWNIHFNILKEFYENQGITISPNADEPINRGMSSGVGKILKFSETMIIIYNFIERKIVSNIELLEPLSKIIIYNMDEIFSLLQEINYENLDRIQFDGKSIWVPTKKI